MIDMFTLLPVLLPMLLSTLLLVLRGVGLQMELLQLGSSKQIVAACHQFNQLCFTFSGFNLKVVPISTLCVCIS